MLLQCITLCATSSGERLAPRYRRRRVPFFHRKARRSCSCHPFKMPSGQHWHYALHAPAAHKPPTPKASGRTTGLTIHSREAVHTEWDKVASLLPFVHSDARTALPAKTCPRTGPVMSLPRLLLLAVPFRVAAASAHEMRLDREASLFSFSPAYINCQWMLIVVGGVTVRPCSKSDGAEMPSCSSTTSRVHPPPAKPCLCPEQVTKHVAPSLTSPGSPVSAPG